VSDAGPALPGTATNVPYYIKAGGKDGIKIKIGGEI